MAPVKLGQIDVVQVIRADGSTATTKLKVVGVAGGRTDGDDVRQALQAQQLSQLNQPAARSASDTESDTVPPFAPLDVE